MIWLLHRITNIFQSKAMVQQLQHTLDSHSQFVQSEWISIFEWICWMSHLFHSWNNHFCLNQLTLSLSLYIYIYIYCMNQLNEWLTHSKHLIYSKILKWWFNDSLIKTGFVPEWISISYILCCYVPKLIRVLNELVEWMIWRIHS